MISYTILVKNEYNELDDLLDFLSHHTNADRSEIIIVGDSKKDEDLENVISRYDDVLKIHLYYRLLKNNFANQKNFANSKCKGRYILNIDADEIPPVLVIENVFDIIDKNKDADAYFFPRINIVRSITQEYIKQMN